MDGQLGRLAITENCYCKYSITAYYQGKFTSWIPPSKKKKKKKILQYLWKTVHTNRKITSDQTKQEVFGELYNWYKAGLGVIL